MRLIIEARVETANAAEQHEPVRLAIINRVDDDLGKEGQKIGLS